MSAYPNTMQLLPLYQPLLVSFMVRSLIGSPGLRARVSYWPSACATGHVVSGKIAQVEVLLGAAAAEVSQLAWHACSPDATEDLTDSTLTSGWARKGKAQVRARRVIDGLAWPRDERNRCPRRGHRLQTSTRGGKSHLGGLERALSLAVSRDEPGSCLKALSLGPRRPSTDWTEYYKYSIQLGMGSFNPQ
jgi:hypothetical protein